MLVKKIDIHVHVAPEKNLLARVSGNTQEDFTTPDELRVMFDKLGIEKGVQLPICSPESGVFDHLITNEDTVRMIEANPDLFYWFCNLDPRSGPNSDKTDFTPLLLAYRKCGARGLGEMTCNMYFDDPRVMNIFRHCEACELPVLFHVGKEGDDYGLIDELGLPRLEKMLKAFPKLQFIGHSQKFWAEISGDCTEEMRDGYPEGPVAPGGRIVELLDKYPNLYCDCSAGSCRTALTRDSEYTKKLILAHPDRFLYARDYFDNEHQNFLNSIAHRLPDGVLDKIYSGNALKLVPLD